MPPVAAAAIAGGIAWASGATVVFFEVSLTGASLGLAVFAANIAMGFISQALAPKPKVPNMSSFGVQASERLQQFRQPLSAWRIIYGEVRMSGPLTFLATTGDNKYLHMVITLAAHPVQEISDIFLDEKTIPADTIDGTTGLVTKGKYKDKVRVFKNLGTIGSQPFPALASATSDWTNTHRQEGHSKIYIRFEHDQDLFPQLPNVSAWVKGKNVLDPRAASTATWGVNPVLCLRDYMRTSTIQGGLGASSIEIDDTFTTAAANTCDEIVSTARIVVSATGISVAVDQLTLQGSTARFFTGDRVVVSATSSAPGGITAGTQYYVIPVQRHDIVRCKLATSFANAVTGTAVDITTVGEGIVTVIKTGEPRYTFNGVLEMDATPNNIVTDMLTAMGGRAIYATGQWRLLAASYASPSLTFDEGDIIAPLQIQTKTGRRDRFNAVKGIYVTTLNLDQPSDYPVITSATYQAEDNGEQSFRELDLPFTNRPHAAMRLAKIELERHRQMITVDMVTSLKGLQVQAGDTVNFTNSRMGWSSKVFEVVDWKLQPIGDPVVIGCGITLRETASDVFDWNSGLETTVDPAPNTSLPDAFTTQPPQNLTVVEALYDTRGSAGVKAKVTLTVTAPGDVFIRGYWYEYKLSSSSTWTTLPRTTDTFMAIFDIDPGTYDFRSRAENMVGVRSSYVTQSNKEINGLLDPPTEPQSVSISSIGGLAILRWTQSSDLDVRIGGYIKWRHDKALTGAAWATSVGIGDNVPGSETVAILPLKEGTYLAKAVDSSGVESLTFASVTTKQATALTYTNVSTITESTVFAGSTTNCIVGSNILKLGASGLVDSIPDIDAVADWDLYGGLVTSGTYVFAGAFDFGTVGKRRLTTTIDVTVTNESDFIDSRTDSIDDWADIDGVDSGAADARVWTRETDDDPTGAPTWSSWMLLDSAEYNARAHEFKLELSTTDATYNVYVSELSVTAATVA